jgi:hypothetical protein
MKHLYAFAILLLVSTGYALWRGDRDHRIVAAICLAAVFATQIALDPVTSRYSGTETGGLLVDVATFGGFLIVALQSTRFWPLWVAGLQLTTSLGHLLKTIDIALLPKAYAVALIFWSYPILLILAIGTWRAHRRRHLTA